MKSIIIYKSIILASIVMLILMLLIYNWDKGNLGEYSFLAEICFGITPGLIFGITFASTFENKNLFKKLIFTFFSTLIYSSIAYISAYFLKYLYLDLFLSSLFGGILIFILYCRLSDNKLRMSYGAIYLTLISIILPVFTVIYEHFRIHYFYDFSIRAFMPILLTIFIWQILFGVVLKECLNKDKTND
jgi:hypothetical protein